MDDPKNVTNLTEENAKTIDVEEVWNFLGRFGPYQICQFAILTIIATCLAVPVVSGLFVGTQINFRCASENTTYFPESNETVVPTQCSIQVRDNATARVLRDEPCNEYMFDGDGVTLSYLAEWKLICENEALGQLPQTLTMAGMGIGAFSLPHLGDRFGRKTLALSCLFALLVVSLATAFVHHFEIFLILKLLSGVCQQGTMVPLAVLVLELLPRDKRSFASFISTSMWVISMTLTGIMGYVLRYYDWRTKQMAMALISSSIFIAIWSLDDSLRWLLDNSKVKQADALLKKACRMNNKDHQKLMSAILKMQKDPKTCLEDLHELLSPVDQQHPSIVNTEQAQPSHNILTVFKNKHMRRIAIIMCYMWTVCALSYYGLILLSTSLAGDPYLNFFIAALLELPSAVAVFYCIRAFGRQRTMLVFQTTAGFLLVGAILIANFAASCHACSIIQTGLTLVGLFFVGGSFNICWLFTPELYPTNQRNAGIGISSCCARIGAMFSPFFTILGRKAVWAPGTVFATGCFISAFLITLVPETAWRELPKTIEDVEGWIREDRAKKAKTKKTAPLI